MPLALVPVLWFTILRPGLVSMAGRLRRRAPRSWPAAGVFAVLWLSMVLIAMSAGAR